jgi:energy-coupling factor transporter ATP-binding protein EcfA2
MIHLPSTISSTTWGVLGTHPTPTAQEARILVITGVAALAIVALTLSILGYCNLLVGLNTTAQWSLTGTAAFLTIAAVAVGCVCAPREGPTVQIKSAQELEVHLKNMCKQLVADNADPLEVIQHYAHLIPQDLLQQAAKVEDGYALATHMLSQARFYLAARTSLSPSLRAQLLQVKNTLVMTLDNILAAFGVADFFKPSDGAIHADFKFQKIIMLISLFTLLTSTLLPMFGVTTGASIVGGTILLIAVLSVIWPHIRPPLPRLSNGENWSELVRSGVLSAHGGGREGAMQQMYHALKAKQHVLIIGPSGIGKTQTVQAFTQGIEQGIYPELTGKEVIYFNVAELADSADLFSQQNTVLKRIEEGMGNNRTNYVLCLDEVHVGFKQQANNSFGDKMKTFLDGMPLVVAMTTECEYMTHMVTNTPNEGPADRRFPQKIILDNTSPEETEAILNHTVIRQAPQALVASGALAYIVQQTKDKPQPLSATSILHQCITYVTQADITPIAQEGAKTRTKLDLLGSSAIVLGRHAILTGPDSFPKMTELGNHLVDLERTGQREEQSTRDLNQVRQRLAEAREAKFKLVEQMGKVGATEADLNQLMLLRHFVEPALEVHIEHLAAQLKIKTVIDQSLIDEVIGQQAENFRKRQKALAKIEA